MVRATGALSPAKARDEPRRQLTPSAIAEVGTCPRLKALWRLSIKWFRLASFKAAPFVVGSSIDLAPLRPEVQPRQGTRFERQQCRNARPSQNAVVVQAAVGHFRSVDVKEHGAPITPEEVD